MKDWTELDFEGTMRDFDYTRRAVHSMNRVVEAKDFQDMDADMIFQHLYQGMEIVSFKDYLKRYIYERAELEEPFREVPDQLYREIIMECFAENRAPHAFHPTTKKWTATVKGWLSQETVHRNVIFLLGFGLGMSAEDVSEFLTKVIKEEDFDFSNPEEVIYWYCYQNQFPYIKAQDLRKKYEQMETKESVNAAKNVNWDDPKEKLADETELLNYLAWLKQAGMREDKKAVAREEFCRLLEHSKMIIARMFQRDADELRNGKTWSKNDIMPADVEKVLCSGIPVNQNGNLKKMSASILAKHFHQKRMSRQRIDGILKRNLQVERFDLITLLFFIYSQEVEPDWPEERYLRFIEEINKILGKCGMMGIYPVNPYETFILMCLLTDCPLAVYSEIWEMSYQMIEQE